MDRFCNGQRPLERLDLLGRFAHGIICSSKIAQRAFHASIVGSVDAIPDRHGSFQTCYPSGGVAQDAVRFAQLNERHCDVGVVRAAVALIDAERPFQHRRLDGCVAQIAANRAQLKEDARDAHMVPAKRLLVDLQRSLQQCLFRRSLGGVCLAEADKHDSNFGVVGSQKALSHLNRSLQELSLRLSVPLVSRNFTKPRKRERDLDVLRPIVPLENTQGALCDRLSPSRVGVR